MTRMMNLLQPSLQCTGGGHYIVNFVSGANLRTLHCCLHIFFSCQTRHHATMRDLRGNVWVLDNKMIFQWYFLSCGTHHGIKARKRPVMDSCNFHFMGGNSLSLQLHEIPMPTPPIETGLISIKAEYILPFVGNETLSALFLCYIHHQ